MARGSYTKITRAGLLVGVLFACSSCVYVHTGDMARSRHEREVPLAAPLTAGSSFSADTGDGSISVRGVETSECKVQAKVVAQAGTEERARELAEQIAPRLEPSGDGLKVVIDRPHTLVNAWYSVSLDVQVPTQTSPKKQWACAISSMESAMFSRDGRAFRIPSWPIAIPSQIPITPNSNGTPPAAVIPSRTFCASVRR